MQFPLGPAWCVVAVLAQGTAVASAQDAVVEPLGRIAVVAPLEDRHVVLGRQVLAGAADALGMPDGGGEGVTPDGIELVVISDPCRGGENGAEDGAAVAEELLAADADAAVGFICWSTLRPALAEGTLDALPILTTGVRAVELTDRARAEGWEVWRLAPRAEAEAEAVAAHILEAWRGRPYAILDDGTVYGRELVGAVTERLLARGSEPVLADTFRPAISRQFGLVRRLEGAGPSHVFIAGERRDIAIIARDSVAAALELTIMGGDALRAVDDDIALPPGVQGIVLGPSLAQGYRAPTTAAIEVLLAARDAARVDGVSLTEAIDAGTFETAIGPITFDALRDVVGNPFVHATWNGERWVPAPIGSTALGSTVPDPEVAPTNEAAE